MDDEIAELYLMEEDISIEQLKDAIKKQTLERAFVPVYMGSAYKNKGVQKLLDAVVTYLPNPAEVSKSVILLN